MKFKKILISLIICLITFTSVSSADDSTTSSIVGDYFNKVFDVELTDGKTLTETDADISKREKINNSIYDGTTKKTYSLYDRFGGNISFVPYFGEKKLTTNLLDKFYTHIVNGTEDDFTLGASEIVEMLTSPSAISNNVVYEGRPNVLSDESLEAGHQDPRVSTYSGVSSVGGSAAIGNLLLYISNIITTTTGWLSGSGIYNTINDIWVEICDTDFVKFIQSMVKYFLPLAIAVFVFKLYTMGVKCAKGYLTGGKIVSYLLSVCLSLGLTFSLMENPAAFSSTLTKLVTIFDDTLDIAINLDSSEVVKSDDLDNVRIAKLWEKNVFNPWCNGMFGADYDKLYTQYDEDDNHTKMKQSNSDVKNNWTNGKVKYNSAELTGDVKVQVGPNTYIRNWAALAWSTQSIYHIDAVKNEDTENSESSQEADSSTSNKKVWPLASTTPMNNQIYVDSFRWIDAKLNISPEYYSPEKVIMSYSNSNAYTQSFISSGFSSLYLSCLLLPIIVLVFRKLNNALLIVTFGIRLLYGSIANFVMPEKYDILSNMQRLITPIYDFFWWSMIIFLSITSYSKLAGNGMVSDLIWLIVGIWLCKFKPIRTPRQLHSVIYKCKTNIKNMSNNVIEKLNK